MTLAHSFKATLCGVALLSGTSGAFDEQPPLQKDTLEIAQALREAALKDNGAYELLESLTTEVGPRVAGSPKERAAIDWAVAKFKAMGFDKVYTEPVTVPYWERISESAAVISPFGQPLVVTALGGSAATPKGGVTAEIAHFASFGDLVAADSASVKGKIVFISNRMKRSVDGSGYGPAVQARGRGASEAAKKGAVAIVIRSIGTDNHRVPHTGGVNYEKDVAKIAAAALSNPDADQLERIISRGKPVTFHLDIQTIDHGLVETANVIAEITGSSLKDDVILLGSHLDSWDLGTGAIDDGAGVAITMAAADLIRRTAPRRPLKTIRVVLYAAEEIGLYGARAYAAAHKADLTHHMMGAESDFGAGKIYALASNVRPESLHVIDAMAKLMGPLGIVRHESKAGGGPDVGQMGRIGMPVIDLKQDGTEYFDLHHTADDTLDKVDPDALRQNLAAWVIYAFIAADYPGFF